jgi:nuclear pore complex protein Nup54
LRAILDSLAAEIRGPGAGAHQMGRLRARLNELWTLLGAAQAARERTKGGAGDGQWAVVDEDGLREIAQVSIYGVRFMFHELTWPQILADQQAGLSHLTRLLQKDLRDLAIIEGTETRDEAGRVSTPVSALTASMGRTAMR